MSRIGTIAFLLTFVCASLGGIAQEAPPPADESTVAGAAPAVVSDRAAPLPPSTERSEAPPEQAVFETEIRNADQAYVAAFNAKDAAALASLWSPEAVYVDRSTGEEIVGREAIAAEYESLFERSPDLKLEIQAEAVQLLSPGVAVEHGAATFISPNADPERIEFVAVWVRRDDQWLLDRVSDEASLDPSPHYERLRELEWMIGEWVDEDDRVTVAMECRWAKNKNFLVREFAVSVGDRIDISGIQVVGWNAEAKRIQSWTFDSDGGFAEGIWSKSRDRWFVQNRGYTSDGGRVAATNVIRLIDDDRFGWRTVETIVDGEILPNVDETLVSRKK